MSTRKFNGFCEYHQFLTLEIPQPAHTVFVCLVYVLLRTAIIFLYCTHWLVILVET
jgi:hypothetical protein